MYSIYVNHAITYVIYIYKYSSIVHMFMYHICVWYKFIYFNIIYIYLYFVQMTTVGYIYKVTIYVNIYINVHIHINIYITLQYVFCGIFNYISLVTLIFHWPDLVIAVQLLITHCVMCFKVQTTGSANLLELRLNKSISVGSSSYLAIWMANN